MLGLIAGQGAFPLHVARAARQAGRKLSCVALRGLTDAGIEDAAERVTWIELGAVADGIAALRAAGVREAVMAGKVPKDLLYGGGPPLQLDASARSLLHALDDRRDDTILGKVADLLASLGIELLPQWALAPELLVGPGVLGRVAPGPAQMADIAFGYPIAKAIGALDIGQTVVVKDRAVIAVEAIEGTDAAIRRAGAITSDACVVKVAKPNQDPRFDVPTIGPGTLESLVAAGAKALAFEAGATLVLERDALAREADARGISVVGVDATSLEEGAP